MLVVAFYMDERNMSFKGLHADQKMMAYKEKGGGLQTDAIFQKEYTYQIFMCNYPLPKIYLAKRVLPPHARVMAFFNTMEEKHHQLAMDNLYKSDDFFTAAYNHEKITDSLCYKERNESHPAMRYTTGIEVKEGKY